VNSLSEFVLGTVTLSRRTVNNIQTIQKGWPLTITKRDPSFALKSAIRLKGEMAIANTDLSILPVYLFQGTHDTRAWGDPEYKDMMFVLRCKYTIKCKKRDTHFRREMLGWNGKLFVPCVYVSSNCEVKFTNDQRMVYARVMCQIGEYNESE